MAPRLITVIVFLIFIGGLIGYASFLRRFGKYERTTPRKDRGRS